MLLGSLSWYDPIFCIWNRSEVFELFWCQWLFSQQKQYCPTAIPLALHLNQKTTIVHILFIQVVSEKLNRSDLMPDRSL